MTELKPCPFCGGEVTIKEYHNPFAFLDGAMRGEIGWYIDCDDCEVVMLNEYCEEDLIEHWNRRVNND